MKNLKKLWLWCKGPSSDLALFILVLILANVVGNSAFFRLDLTSNRVFSLSPASTRILKTVEDPIKVDVFFSSNLPAPYNGVQRYLKDLLTEYRSASRANFSWVFHNMEKAESEELAQEYGLRALQIQEVKNNEVGFKMAWMGLAIVYSDAIETIDQITSANALEYKLSTTIGKMINTTDALAGLTGKVAVNLYLTPELKNFQIAGLDKIESASRAAVNALQPRFDEKIEFNLMPIRGTADVDAASLRYGLQKVSWVDDGSGKAGAGVFGLVLEHGDKFKLVPVEMNRGIFGGYALTSLDYLEKDISDTLQALVSRSLKIGYLTSNGERDIQDDERGAGRLAMLASDYYDFEEIALYERDIPADISCLVVNGPRSYYSDLELYRMDQFLLRGGRLLILADSLEERQDQQMSWMGSMPSYEPIDHRLNILLNKYGLNIETNYVFDEKCYSVQQRGLGEFPLYYVPIITRERLAKNHPITKNLDHILLLKPSEITIREDIPATVRATVLAKTTPNSWVEGDISKINLSPLGMDRPKEPELLGEHAVIALLEGRFSSAFDAQILPDQGDVDDLPGRVVDRAIEADRHLNASVQDGAIVVMGTSEPGSSSLLDEHGAQPIAVLMRNVLDYLNGNAELNQMRVKSLDLNLLRDHENSTKNFVKALNMYVLPLLVLLSALIAWRMRKNRRRAIERRYALIKNEEK